MREPAGSEHCEGEEGRSQDGAEHGRPDRREAASAASPDPHEGERNEDDRVQLHGDRGGEQDGAEPVPAREQRRGRSGRERRRPEIETALDDRAEEHRRGRDHGERNARAHGRGPEDGEREPEQERGGDAAAGHPAVEGPVVGRLVI